MQNCYILNNPAAIPQITISAFSHDFVIPKQKLSYKKN